MNVHDHFLKYALEMPPTWIGMAMEMEGERIHPKGAPGLLFQQSSLLVPCLYSGSTDYSRREFITSYHLLGFTA